MVGEQICLKSEVRNVILEYVYLEKLVSTQHEMPNSMSLGLGSFRR